MIDNRELFLEVRDFQKILPSLPDKTILIRSRSKYVFFAMDKDQVEPMDLSTKKEYMMWVRGERRKYCRQVVFEYYPLPNIDGGVDHYIIYAILDPD